jgi:hypothetical protein
MATFVAARRTVAAADPASLRASTHAVRRGGADAPGGLLLPGGPTGPGSVDVQHGFAADAAVEQGVDRLGGLAPGAFQLDLGVEAAVCGQGAQAR